MGIWAKLKDGWGSDILGRINEEGALHVIAHPHPPEQFDVKYPAPLTQFFTNNGSNDMIVAGSLNSPIDFCINANQQGDIYIKSITIRISDTNMQLDDFGGLSPLINGIDLIYKDQTLGERPIISNITTNIDFFRSATGGKNFGSGSNSWKADVSGAGADTYFPEIDISSRFGPQFGFRLQKNTTDFLCFRIKPR